MQFIPTTATAVQKIKLAAKAISKSTEVSHTQALEQASKASGYLGWFHVQHCQKASAQSSSVSAVQTRAEAALAYSQFLDALPRAEVEIHAFKGDAFHEVSIEGQRFTGYVAQTGDVYLRKLNAQFGIDFSPQIQIGAASIRKVETSEDHSHSTRAGNSSLDLQNPMPHGKWWICKHDANENRIDLGDMSEEGRNALAREFGLPIIPHSNLPKPTEPWARFAYGSEDSVFYTSPAYKALLDWAALHPRKARTASNQAIYLTGWLTPKI